MPYKNPVIARTHRSWRSMIARCLHRKSNGFQRYGAAGVKVCIRWLKFENFLKDMGFRPEGTVLDRIQNTGGYCGPNCRWATPFESTENRKNTIWIKFKNKRMRVKEAAKKYGIAEHLIYARLYRGWSPIEAVSLPPVNHGYSEDGVLCPYKNARLYEKP